MSVFEKTDNTARLRSRLDDYQSKNCLICDSLSAISQVALWKGRYPVCLVQGDSYLHGYIELNPLRANLTDSPADYRWSSYLCNALGQRDPRIDPHEDYLRLGREPAERQALYRDCFGYTSSQRCFELSGKPPRRTGCLALSYFQQQIEAALALRIAKRKPGPRKRECSLG